MPRICNRIADVRQICVSEVIRVVPHDGFNKLKENISEIRTATGTEQKHGSSRVGGLKAVVDHGTSGAGVAAQQRAIPISATSGQVDCRGIRDMELKQSLVGWPLAENLLGKGRTVGSFPDHGGRARRCGVKFTSQLMPEGPGGRVRVQIEGGAEGWKDLLPHLISFQRKRRNNADGSHGHRRSLEIPGYGDTSDVRRIKREIDCVPKC